MRGGGLSALLLLAAASSSSSVLLRPGESQGPLPPPQHVTHEDVERYSAEGDLDSLSKNLVFAFKNSARVRGPDKVELREVLTARGAGFTYTSAYKMEHDIMQLEHIINKTQGSDQARFLEHNVLPSYRALLAKIPPIEQLERTAGLFAFGHAPEEASAIAPYYNRALNVPDYPPLEGGHLNPDLDLAGVEKEYFAADPSVCVVDNVLSQEALTQIRQLLAESTVWYETKMPERFGGYVGAYLNDGLHQRILLALTEELREKLPNILGKHALRHLWAYKYDERYSGINVHADEAAVNLNFWVTPEDANLDKESGGLVVYTKKPPPDWTFDMYNQFAEGGAARELLEESGWANVTIPYKENRLVMFDSALFHKTDSFQFKPGFLNRRINLTLLFGRMNLGHDAACSASPGLR
mmetsp:Transcript_15343/g.38557  ORF Transcript_15343/g.38557 Transcript_15343/m.38557 type:complete len:411 (+) Transcript_15343:161-1393(+)